MLSAKKHMSRSHQSKVLKQSTEAKTNLRTLINAEAEASVYHETQALHSELSIEVTS